MAQPVQPQLDPRLHAYKADVAAAHLEGQVEAARFVEGVPHRVRVPVSDMFGMLAGESRTSQALFGETFTVYQTEGFWAWGQLDTDGYVGWLSALDLVADDGRAATHRVAPLLSRATDVSIKVLGTGPMPMGAQLRAADTNHSVGGSSAPFRQTDAGAMPAMHLVPTDDAVGDWVAVAEQFHGSPYVWGGRTAMGLDCSALVQLAMQRGGMPCPRDSDMQEAVLGVAIDRAVGLRRGDLVFWPGHVGVMADSEELIHANAWAMAVGIEPLTRVEGRVGAARCVRRLA